MDRVLSKLPVELGIGFIWSCLSPFNYGRKEWYAQSVLIAVFRRMECCRITLNGRNYIEMLWRWMERRCMKEQLGHLCYSLLAEY